MPKLARAATFAGGHRWRLHPPVGGEADLKGMGTDALFIGNALRAVDADGGTQLPRFVLRALAARGSDPTVIFGGHEADPCISGYDEGHQEALHAEIKRRRRRDVVAGAAPAAHYARARRAFGLIEQARYDAAGRIALPPMMRHKGRIGDRALFIGTGDNFEIWSPDLAREAADDEVRELARFALSQDASNEESEAEP